MTKPSENFELTNNYNAEQSSDRVDLPALSQGRSSTDQLALAAQNQTDLINQRVIPNVEIENDGKNSGAKGDWASARIEAKEESERNIGQGKHIHHIRYGDTLWDIASASFNKNSGHKASAGEILGEVNRLAKKNNVVDMNNIPIGTAIDTSPEGAKSSISPPLNRTPNYYDLNGGARRNVPNLVERQPSLTYRQPERRSMQDVLLTPELTRELLQGRQERRTSGASDINPTMETTARAKNTGTWRNAHSELTAKARRGAPNVAFYGDSITQGLQLNPGFKTSFGGSENFGIGGDTNENLLYRLRDGEANFTGRKPDTAVLLIGTNNIGSQRPDKIAAGILANAKEMSTRMPGTEIVVMGVLPRGFSPNDPLRQQVNEVNALVRRQLDGVAGVKFVDIGPQLLDASGNMRGGIFQRDNVHLTYNTGYTAMLRALQPHVRARR